MSLYDWLLTNRSKEELAKELAKTARDLAHAQNRVHEVETELFWLKVQLKNDQHTILD